MSEITKSTFILNKTFSAKKRFKMQLYLNKMSANGLHISEIRKSKCRFTEDASVRYIYSICGEGDESLYTEESGWVHFCTYKGVSFFKRAVPADAVKLVRTYKKKQTKAERSWLLTRLREGLRLIGKVENEYIFSRFTESKCYDYIVRHPKKQKKTEDGTVPPPLGNTDGLTFICANDNGTAYYFVKDITAQNAVAEERGRRLSDQIFSIFAATGAAIGFCAAAFAIIYGLLKGGALMLPLAICGGVCALVFIVLFAVYFKKFQKVSEARRIFKEEQRLKREAEGLAAAQKEEKISEGQNNTVVMNTVVMNNYGQPTAQQNGIPTAPSGLNAYGTLYGGAPIPTIDPSINPALDPNVNPAIAAAANPAAFASSVADAARYGNAADTLIQGDNASAPADIFTPLSAIPAVPSVPAVPSSTSINDDDWVAAADENENEDEGEDDLAPENENAPFPIGMFIFGAVSCFVAALAIIFGLRFGILFFVNFGAESPLTLLASAVGIAFSPFALRFGISTCKSILSEHAYEDEDEDDIYG